MGGGGGLKIFKWGVKNLIWKQGHFFPPTMERSKETADKEVIKSALYFRTRLLSHLNWRIKMGGEGKVLLLLWSRDLHNMLQNQYWRGGGNILALPLQNWLLPTKKYFSFSSINEPKLVQKRRFHVLLQQYLLLCVASKVLTVLERKICLSLLLVMIWSSRDHSSRGLFLLGFNWKIKQREATG